MPNEDAELVVIGGGLAGAALAFHLGERNLGRVVGLEASTPAAGATGRAAGILSEQLWDRWDVEVVRESRREYEALAAGAAPGAIRRNGFVRWTANAATVPLLRERCAELRSWGVDVREPAADELRELLPALSTEGVRAAAYAPADAVIAPSQLAEAYVAAGRRAGVDWRLASPATEVRREAGRWMVRTRRATWRARSVVVAAGAWSKRILAGAGHPVPITPYRTQAAVLRRPDGFDAAMPSFHDLDSDVYGRPEENGRLLAGDGTEKVEADPETYVPSGDAAFVMHLAEALSSRLPGWTEVSVVRSWAGVCVATPDRRPMIGPVPGADGLYTITGFNGFGVMRAAGAAARLAEAIARNDGTGGPGLATVDPRRFPPGTAAVPPKPGFTLSSGSEPAV